MAKGFGFSGGREILITRGLADWILHFEKTRHAEYLPLNQTSAGGGLPGSREEIVVLFANIIKESGFHGI